MTCAPVYNHTGNHVLAYSGVNIGDVHYGNQQLTALDYAVAVENISTATGVGVQIIFLDWTGAFLSAPPILAFLHAGGLQTGTLTPPSGAAGYQVQANVNVGHDGTTADLHILLTPTCGASLGEYCAYGTRPSGLGRGAFYLAPSVIEAALFRIGKPQLAPFFSAWYYAKYDVDALCGVGPPAMPPLTALDLVGPNPGDWSLLGSHKLDQALAAILWPHLCECKPATGGGAAPVDFPDPNVVAPADLPTLPHIDCDTTSVCSALNSLVLTVADQGQILRQMRDMVTLIQRQEVPFAYVFGDAHNGLSGTGEFSVQGILGLSVILFDIPGYVSRDTDHPTGYYNLGEIALGAEEGWQQTQRLRHSPTLILNVNPSITRVSYAFPEPINANILELIREP